jgi:colanic acid/amylovoran biosynthesis glycosyltransferase
MKKELWLFTRQFPSGSGEVFLENALPVWVKHFSRVRVFPMFTGPGMVKLPEGAEAQELFADPFATPSLMETVTGIPLLFRLLSARGGGSSPNAAGPFAAFSHARQLMQRYKGLLRLVKNEYDPTRVVILTAWMEDWVTLLGLLKESGHPLRLSTLAHRSDLFAPDGSDASVPHRAFRVQHSDRILCIAQDGLDELRRCFPQYAPKMELIRLGTPDHGLAPWSPATELRLASCSYTTPRKRVERIAESLALVKRPVHWTHFGDGSQLGAVQALVDRLPSHVRVDLHGATSNADVLRAYATTPFDLFIHLSAHEGLPVVLMEATSFGIPLLATDVGGVYEIVDRRTGHLLPADAAPADVARWLDAVEQYRVLDDIFRSGVRQAWSERFEASANFGHIAELVEGSA